MPRGELWWVARCHKCHRPILVQPAGKSETPVGLMPTFRLTCIHTGCNHVDDYRLVEIRRRLIRNEE